MIKTEVDFSKKIREWDGFGFNYVETCQTYDYNDYPQDYGGFSTLSEEQRQEIIDLIFGEDGLKPGIIKMFFNPLMQKEDNKNQKGFKNINLDNYDHQTSTKWMRYFVKNGLKKAKASGRDFDILTTMYSPPGWMTEQGFIRGRDLDPDYKEECAKYMVAWAKYLKEKEGLPVKYISIHNEGEDFVRWPEDGGGAAWDHGHDYNMYWSPEMVAEFIKLTDDILKANNLADVGVTPGETTNWQRFAEWGYAYQLADDEEALEKLGLISSHGFLRYGRNRWFSDAKSLGNDVLRAKRPELHSWVNSIDWGTNYEERKGAYFLNDYRKNIYTAKVNGIIPWAGIQCDKFWTGGDPNPDTAFRVNAEGEYTIEEEYYFYKQLCRAGQPGTAVARVISNDSEIGLMGFAGNGTDNPDSLVVINTSEEDKSFDLEFKGTDSEVFAVYRTTPDGEKYEYLGESKLDQGLINYKAPSGSATTFFGR